MTDRDSPTCGPRSSICCARPDADPKGIGVFGISKGGSTGLARRGRRAVDPLPRRPTARTARTRRWCRTCKRWIQIYSDRKLLQRVLPTWFYGIVGMAGAKKVARNRGVNYPASRRPSAG